jgi:hypothetical protein
MKTKILDVVSQSLELFENSKKEEAIRFLNTFLETVKKNTENQAEYDLAMETYIFLTSGDLRKEGRDFGFADTNEIKNEISKLKDTQK